ncbi:MAG: DUF1203 domain-containing protein [Proteobacteria bacterium]|nr:DUF1203 domain-containing protein [Pseudomonadota bacterium]
MSFVISGLPAEPFRPLFDLDDEALAARGAVRIEAGPEGRFPCRVSLEDAAPGERLLLVNFEHQPAGTPYRSNYAIYVREAAAAPRRFQDELPPVLKNRPIALRAFDAEGMLIGAELVAADGDLTAAIGRGLESPQAAYLHAHNAAHGCFAARIDRA